MYVAPPSHSNSPAHADSKLLSNQINYETRDVIRPTLYPLIVPRMADIVAITMYDAGYKMRNPRGDELSLEGSIL